VALSSWLGGRDSNPDTVVQSPTRRSRWSWVVSDSLGFSAGPSGRAGADWVLSCAKFHNCFTPALGIERRRYCSRLFGDGRARGEVGDSSRSRSLMQCADSAKPPRQADTPDLCQLEISEESLGTRTERSFGSVLTLRGAAVGSWGRLHHPRSDRNNGLGRHRPLKFVRDLAGTLFP